MQHSCNFGWFLWEFWPPRSVSWSWFGQGSIILQGRRRKKWKEKRRERKKKGKNKGKNRKNKLKLVILCYGEENSAKNLGGGGKKSNLSKNILPRIWEAKWYGSTTLDESIRQFELSSKPLFSSIWFQCKWTREEYSEEALKVKIM